MGWAAGSVICRTSSSPGPAPQAAPSTGSAWAVSNSVSAGTGACATPSMAAVPVVWGGRGHTVSCVSRDSCAVPGNWGWGAGSGSMLGSWAKQGPRDRPVALLRPACPPGRYGAACRLECTCQNNGTCDPTTGTCRCGPGFYGQACEHSESWARARKGLEAQGRAFSWELPVTDRILPQPAPQASTELAARGAASVSTEPPVTPSVAGACALPAPGAPSVRRVSAVATPPCSVQSAPGGQGGC